ncbi:Methyltransferase type 11 (plasmid) [Solidesulfovibrio carbinoliphilus subsp. oakridgensis]|uniref:Methyltransferase type 11 n=1 Tax=Solidesulfovibrio carbinoliphilus subsp. oakridgensis TaxID=694327 RepID=G7QEC2_9BACT|nr:methyltransferase domain-containing protein [Solidesulfovibrio carbinoliphilus]EHJ46016.1 Methyltransferase type 11 [Solidesulfovibrio carbinoliphilus subsp. oakridgensis]
MKPTPGPFAASLQKARHLAQTGRADICLALCQDLAARHGDDPEALLAVGALLLSQGFLARARDCFEAGGKLAPHDHRFGVNLANVDREAGDHAACRRRYAALERLLPDNPVLRRNALVSLEYDPTATDAERLAKARQWGAWAMARAGGTPDRPPLSALSGRPLRVGYVSADFCQHPVGLFVQDVLAAHDPGRVVVHTYDAGSHRDDVTERIRRVSVWRDVAGLADAALAGRIRADGIDVLVDLSGHTAGSRLTAFALRPAPVLASWLGYFATTGLPVLDAVLLDPWHAPPGTEAWFTETVVRLPRSRFCYRPVPFAPDVAPPPCLDRGHVTYGCCNNTAKLNPQVFALWAEILRRVPDARLVLKWRTFRDDALRQRVRQTFAGLGVDPGRLDLRGPSFHADLLQEYADIDIALDPFPFSGGHTSCECLWMGVPVVTWPGSRLVSRQTLAFLANLDRPDWLGQWVADNPADYVTKACALGAKQHQIGTIRHQLRPAMQAAPLTDAARFTRDLEAALINLYQTTRAKQHHPMPPKHTALHIGTDPLPKTLQTEDWKEVPAASLANLPALPDASLDAVHCAHQLQYLPPHEVPGMLAQIARVLRPQGFAVLTCPDLEAVAQAVVEGKLLTPVYNAAAGPITPLDLLYGYRPALAAGQAHLAHRCGFTLPVLTQILRQSGFATVGGLRRPAGLDLWVLASKATREEAPFRQMVQALLAG